MSRSASKPKMSLRERNRLATHDAIAEAAVLLCMRDGIDAVRVEDIAQEAGIALRTFRHYFANKYEALVARHLAWMRMAADVLRERPPEEPLWDAITAAFVSHWDATSTGNKTPSLAQLRELRLLFGDRNLQGEILKAGVAEDSEFAQVIAERCGVDLARNNYPRMVAGAVTVVTLAAVDSFLNADPPAPIKPLIVQAIEQLARGFPGLEKPRAKRASGRARASASG